MTLKKKKKNLLGNVIIEIVKYKVVTPITIDVDQQNPIKLKYVFWKKFLKNSLTSK